jgi:hypothetical protein
MMKKLCIILAFFLFLGVGLYQTVTIFVVQPIGAIPEGKTLIISRMNNTTFVDSADAMCARQGGVNLICRGIALGAIVKNADIYLRLPYSKLLYLLSTNGAEYTR